MQQYPVKPGHAGKIDFKMIFEAAFMGYTEEDGWLKSSYGSMPKIWAKQDGKKFVIVDTETDLEVAKKMVHLGSDDPALAAEAEQAATVAKDTQRTWNDFLEGVTGYDAKKRSKKIQEQAKKDAKAAAEKAA